MLKYLALFSLLAFMPIMAYENLLPAQVHARLVAGDTLQLLDVRENSEYSSGHIAEPAGLPVLFPANMPWTSAILEHNFQLLPTNMDIVVYCRSGGRSSAASAFLESRGFTRIFNMTSGFSGWSYDSRAGNFGDGSGAWIESDAATIPCSQFPTTASLLLAPGVAQSDRMYIEWHKINPAVAPFENVPDSAQLYLTIVVDQFGLSLFKQDTLSLNTLAEYHVVNQYPKVSCQFFSPTIGWLALDSQVVNGIIAVTTKTLYKWLLFIPDVEDAIADKKLAHSFALFKAYPNPFNEMLRIDTPTNALISIYDVQGRFVTKVENNIWHPGSSTGSGLYFVRIAWQDHVEWQKVIYDK